MEDVTPLSSVGADMRGITVQGEVTEAKDIRTFNKFGKEGQVQEVVIKDDSGTGVLTLWNEQAGTLKPGDKLKATGVYTKEFRDEVQLHISRQGSLEKL
jgi:replication factor A1